MSAESVMAYESLKAVSQGQAAPESFRMAWGVHEGMRGANWIMLDCDGRVLTNTIKPTRGPFVPQKPTEVGQVSAAEVQTFCAILCAQRFDMLDLPEPGPADLSGAVVEFSISMPNARYSIKCPSPKLDDVYALAEIGNQFRDLKTRFAPA